MRSAIRDRIVKLVDGPRAARAHTRVVLGALGRVSEQGAGEGDDLTVSEAERRCAP